MTELKINKTESDYAFIKPFLYKKASMTIISLRMLVLLAVQILLLVLSKSYNALYVISGSFIGALLAFLVGFALSRSPAYTAIEILLQGIMIGMLLPETYPPVVAMLVSFVLFIIIKYIFSNNYNIWVNTIALGVVVAWFIGKNFFPNFLVSAELIGMKNPSLVLIQKGAFPVSSFDGRITSFLNNTIFRLFHISIPNGYVSLMWDTHSVIPAFRFNLVTIISSLFLFSDDGVETLIPGVFLFVYALLVRLFAPVLYGGAYNTGDVILALFSSGTLFCAVFLMQWFGTIPGSFAGKIVSAVSTGVFAFLIVGCGTSSVGMVYTVLISNILTVVIKVFEDKQSLSLMRKTLAAKEEVYTK